MKQVRNIAIIAHVDHGKTTLVDKIIETVTQKDNLEERILDSNDLEKERGITILAKNIAVEYKDVKLNIIDTPGHADFGGQVERVLKMADGVLLLVDAAEGPMPQTRFVLTKALALGLKPLVFINKIDKKDSRAEEVLNVVFDLFVELEATDEQLDFVTLYGSGRDGYASLEEDGGEKNSILPLLDSIVNNIPAPQDKQGPVQMQITTLDYSSYLGKIGIGRVFRGTLDTKNPVKLIRRDGSIENAQIKQLFVFDGLEKKEVFEVNNGDICIVVGIEEIEIGDTITDAQNIEALPAISLDEPTISMLFRINDSILYGKEGTLVSSRKIKERLEAEAQLDAALIVNTLQETIWEVSGRGVLHLSILLENMRREGYELAVSQPRVIFKKIDGVECEPIEILTINTPDSSVGKIIELVGTLRGEMNNLEQLDGRQIIDFTIPSRGLIGLRTKVMTLSAGEAIVHARFEKYEPKRGAISGRRNGVILSTSQGKAEAYAINALQARGKFFVNTNEECYEGMIVGEHCKEGDIVVNLQKAKQLTNVRASGTDKALKITPAIKMSLEEMLEYIQADELLEVTPKNLRMRKFYLKEVDRKRNRQEFL